MAGKGEVITRDELIDTVWSGAAGADQSLNQAVSRLRSVLGDSPFEREFIETVPKRGYRLIADIALLEPHKSVEDAQAAEEKTDSEKRQMAAVRHDGTSRPEQSIDRRRLLAVAAVLAGVILAVIYQQARTTGPAEGPDPMIFTHSESAPADLAELLRPAPPEVLELRDVSDAVNDVRQDGPQLLEPSLKLS